MTYTRRCPDCPAEFFTSAGLAEHVESGCRLQPDGTLRRTYSEASRRAMSDGARSVAAANNIRRVRCSCGMETTPGALGTHQLWTGHVGREELALT